MESSRTHKSLYNSMVAMAYYVVGLFLGFWSRKIFLDYLGTEILGLNTTAQNLLQFLNLAELGIGASVGFSLYKPLNEKDDSAVNEIVTLQGLLYKRIGLFLIIGSGILMAFFPLIFKKMDLPLWYAYASFSVLLFSSLLGYFVNYKQVVLTSSQKNYKVQYSYTTVTLLKVLFQMVAVAWFANGYVWWLGIEAAFSIVASWSLHLTTLKEFPWLKKVNSTYRTLKSQHAYLVRKIKQLFFHKIAGYALTQSSPLIIYALIDLSLVAIYGNYLLIVVGIQKIVAAMFNSMDAGVGNLVAQGDDFKIRQVFKELFAIRFVIAAVLSFAFLTLTSSFVSLWIGTEYLLPTSTTILLTISLFIMLSRFTVDTFLNAYGLYGDIWAPIAETVLNIGLSLLIGYFYGLNGIITGVLISQVTIVVGWKPFYLTHKRMRGFLIEYIKDYAISLCIGLLSGWISWKLTAPIIDSYCRNFLELIGKGFVISMLYMIILAVGLWIFTPGMKMAVRRVLSLVLKNKLRAD